MALPASDRWDDANFVAVLQRRILVLKKTDVFLVHVHVYEAADFAFVIDQPFLDSRESGLEFGNRGANGGRIDLDDFLVVRQFAQGSWDAYFLGHNKVRVEELRIDTTNS